MAPLKRFEEWFERRQLIVKAILIGLPMTFFIVCFGLVCLYFLYAAPMTAVFSALALFVVSGFVVLFVVVSIRKRLGNYKLVLRILLFMPFSFWGFWVWYSIVVSIYGYWDILLLLLTFVSAILVVWKLWGKRQEN